MRILYYLAGIGQPNYRIKQNVFFSNIKKISDQKHIVDVIINIYILRDQGFIYKIKKSRYINKFYINKRIGVLAELWKNNEYNSIANRYDYILFILDDVLLENFDLNKLVSIKNEYHLDIISPKVINATYNFMNYSSDDEYKLLLTNAIEFYCYLIKPEIFYKLIDIHEIDNKWCWGLDFMLGYFKFKCGVSLEYSCKHLYSQTNSVSTREAYLNMIKFLNKYGFKSLYDIKTQYPPIINYIK